MEKIISWKKKKRKRDGNNEATFLFLFSFFLSLPPLLLFPLFVYSQSIRVFLRERKLTFKFLNVEIESTSIEYYTCVWCIWEGRGGGEFKRMNIKYSISRAVGEIIFRKKKKERVFHGNWFDRRVIYWRFDFSFFFFFWLENEFFVRDGSDNLMELVKKRNEIINEGKTKFKIAFYKILFLSSRYQRRAEYFSRAFRNNLWSKGASIFYWKMNFLFADLTQVIKRCNEKFFILLPFILIHMSRRIFFQRWLATKSCLDVSIFY